jgi:AcrR family transcriptional regulator
MSENPTQSRRDEYAEITRTALIDAAREIFVEAGFQQAGIEAIARRARVTRGAFYHHFVDKQALFEALVIELQANAALRLTESARAEGDPFARLRAGARAFLEVCVDPAYRRLVIQDAPAVLGSKRSREIGEAYAFGILGQALVDMKSTGLIVVDDPWLAGRMIGAMICEAAVLLGDADQPKALERHALEIVDRAFRALAPTPG